MSTQPRITLTPDYNWRRLKREIDERPDETFIIVGIGRPLYRRLLKRVVREFPEAHWVPAHGVPISFNPWEFGVMVNRSAEAISWGPGEPGKPPIVEHEQGWAEKRAAVEASVAKRS